MIAKVSAFAKRAWKQPQQLWLRRAFFQVHLWCGVFLALYIIAIGVSGSILVFEDELAWRPHTESRGFNANDCTAARLLGAMHSAMKAHPKLIVNVASCPIEANPLYVVTLRPADDDSATTRPVSVFVDSNTGTILGESVQGAGWLAMVEQFHLDLFLKKNGRQWNGAAAAVLLILTISGLGLWWPGVRNWKRAFKIDFRRTWKRINWDIHSAVGIWTIFFSMAWAVTGIYFGWPAQFERAINSISPIVTASYPEDELKRIAEQPLSSGPATLNLQEVLNESQHNSPGEHLEGLFFGSGQNPVLTVYMARAHLGDYTKSDFLYFDQKSGQHLFTWHRGQNKTLGDWMLWLLVPLHFGTSWGLAGKIVWCTLGLALPVLAVTGLLMYWNRWLRKVLVRS